MEPEKRFDYLALLGEGGMGFVYKVLDKTNGRICALKVSKLDQDQVALKRFVKECSIWFEFRHLGHVTEVYEIVQITDSRIAILMDYIDGGNLRECMRNNSLSLQDKLVALHDIATSLSDCREEMHGFAHYDIKPENCLRTRYGLTKLTDFGISAINYDDLTKASTATMSSGGSCIINWNNSAGSILAGTPLYIAPEQITGRGINGHLADIYSFGIMALELLTGVHPIEISDVHQILNTHINGIPSNNRIWPKDVPNETTAVLDSCMEIDPSKRPSITDIMECLIIPLSDQNRQRAMTGLSRIPDSTEDNISKANSLWSLGQEERAVSVLLNALKDDPFQGECWLLAARYKLALMSGILITEISNLKYGEKKDIDQSTAAEIARWVFKALVLRVFSSKESAPLYVEFVTRVCPSELRMLDWGQGDSLAPEITEWIASMIGEQKQWLESQEPKEDKHPHNHRTLCVECGEIKSAIVTQCPRCGFIPIDMKDLFNTCSLQINCMKFESEPVPFSLKMKELRSRGSNIRSTIAELESLEGYKDILADFTKLDGKFFQGLAVGDHSYSLEQFFRDKYSSP
jgi:serine/threonine protein kinase